LTEIRTPGATLLLSPARTRENTMSDKQLTAATGIEVDSVTTSPGAETEYASRISGLIPLPEKTGRTSIEVDSATTSPGAETEYADRISVGVFFSETELP